MTPRFAEAIDPILLHMFSLLERLEAGTAVSAAEEKRSLEILIQQADSRLSDQSGRWEPAKYALTSWIDEMLIDAHIWEGRGWWRENVLEWTLFNSRRCNDLYFINGNKVLNSDADDALQMIYVCVLLGFRGLYRDPKLSRVIIDNNALPHDLNTWSDEFANAVRQARQRWNDATPAQVIERDVVTATPLWTKPQVVWPWLIAVMLAGLNVILFYRG